MILQDVMRRLGQRLRTDLFADLGTTMKLPRSAPGRLSLEMVDLADVERPPIIEVAE